MSAQTENFTDQAAAFQKMWAESLSRLMQAAFTFSPEAAPPELLRQIRNGILQALADAWDDFLRSPEFQQGMKQWLDGAIAFRQAGAEALNRAHREMQTPSRQDMDGVMQAMRHMETRLLDRVEQLAKELAAQSAKTAPARARMRRKTRTRKG